MNANISQPSSSPSSAIAVIAMVQRYFDESLLIRLVEAGTLTRVQAREICIQTATFAHELTDDESWLAIASAVAANFEQMGASFEEKL